MIRRKKLVIAIDGPAGSGKSSTAKALAKRLKIPYIDTGAMYRALTFRAIQEGILFHDRKRLIALSKKISVRFSGTDPEKQKVFLNDKDVTLQIRLPEVTQNVFYVAREPLIRREMVKKQRSLGQRGSAVMEGRDIGTVVFPDADYKFYFEAKEEVRARRRQKELIEAGNHAPLAKVLRDMKERDRTDIERKEGPLKKAKDAICIDTTPLTIEETVDKMMRFIQSKPLNTRQLNKSGHSKA